MRSPFSILALITFGLLSYGLYQALIVAPREMTMGDAQRIFYYHVPSAWTAFFWSRVRVRPHGQPCGALVICCCRSTQGLWALS